MLLGLAVLGVEAAPTPCSATTGLRLDWTRDESASSCPSGAEIARSVTGQLDCAPFATATATAAVEVRVSARSGPGWQAALSRYDAEGALIARRTLLSDEAECDTLGEALVLTLVFLAEELPPAPPQTPDLRPPALVTTAPGEVPGGRRQIILVPARPETRPQPRAPSGLITTSGVLSAGTLPNLAGGLQLGARWRLGLAGVGLGLTVLPPQDFEASLFGLFGGYLSGCLIGDGPGGIGFEGCLRVRGGSLSSAVRPEASNPIRVGNFGWVGGSAVGRAVLPLGAPFFLVVEAEALASFVDRRFYECDAADGTCNAGGGPITGCQGELFAVCGSARPVFDEEPVAFLGTVGLGVEFLGFGE